MVVGAVITALLSSPALAQPLGDAAPPPREAKARDPKARAFALDGSLMAGWQHTKQYGESVPLYLGATLLYRPSIWIVGANVQVGGAIWEQPQEFFGLLGGVGLEATPWLRVDILGEGGVHLEHPTTGFEILGDEVITGGETTGAVPYAGLRVAPTFLIGERNSFMVGPWLQFRQDLLHAQLDYQVASCFITCGETTLSTTIGGTLLAAGLRIGGQFGSQ